MAINGTSGDDTLTGTSGNDIFNLGQGGNDTVSGLGGNDTFRFGTTFTAADHVDGGTGNDTIELNGDYSAGLTLGADTITAVETIKLDAGFNYALTLNDGNVAAGNTLSINASALTDGNTVTFDGSAETDGTLHVTGGTGNDSLTLGAHLTAADRIAGGGGDDELFLAGNYSMTFASTTLRYIAHLVLGAGDFTYHFNTNDANVESDSILRVDGAALGAGNTLIFNGAKETDGSFSFDGGAGLMELTGGAQGDQFFMGDDLTNSDRLNGDTGADVLYLDGDYTISLKAAVLRNIADITLAGGSNYHIVSGGNTGGNVTIDGSQLGAGDSEYFNAGKESGSFTFTAGAGPATLIGGGGDDVIDMGGQLIAGDSINGGTGNDTVELDGDYSAGLTLGASTISNVENLVLAAGHSYNLTTNDANDAPGAGSDLEVNADGLGPSNTLIFNGSAETDSHFSITPGAGNDVLTGGALGDTFELNAGGNDTVHGGGGGDTFDFSEGSLTAADTIDGGTGDDVLFLSGDYSGGLTLGAATITNVENLALYPGFDYKITTSDGNVASGQTLTVNATVLGVGDHLTFDGAAETDGHFDIKGGPASDDLTGGALSDTFYYSTLIGVTGAVRDTIHAFDFANDVVQFADVSGIASAFTVGSVNAASIDADLTNIVNSSRLPANDAVLYTAKTGNLAGHTFLIVDGNGVAGYQTGSDLVIELSGALHTGSINIDNFIE